MRRLRFAQRDHRARRCVDAGGGTCTSVISCTRAALAAATSLAGLAVAASPAQAALVEAWGYNLDGQIGDGTTTKRTAPVAVTGLDTGVTAVAGGQFHSLAVKDGAAFSWGFNISGQLGDGTNNDRYVAGAVAGLGSGVTAVAGGFEHSLAVRNGTAYSWGDNSNGQLGDGTTNHRYVPVAVTGLGSGVTAVAGGYAHSLALRNGNVYAWGDNTRGQIGDGTSGNIRTAPVAVTGLGSGVTTVAGGYAHSLAVRNGAAYAWGSNAYGQLGDGSTTNRATPLTVTGLGSGVTAVAGGYAHSLALRNGNVYAWGDNGNGQLGDGTMTDRLAAFQVDPADLTGIVAVAAAASSSYALSSDGSLWAWGHNDFGEVGQGTLTYQYLVPQHVLPPSGYQFTAIAAGINGEHAVAMLEAVPEPASAGLLMAAGGVGLLARRRRRLVRLPGHGG
jgi:alpha-tubulin suppressor-like RCC1 family protein